MKKREISVFFVALVMMILCPAISFSHELTSGLDKHINEYKKIINTNFIGEDVERFVSAVRTGNLSVVKYFIETYPDSDLLDKTIVNEKGEKTIPICIAAANGHTDLVNYILEQRPSLVNARCYLKDKPFFIYQGDDERTPLWETIENIHADTALSLLSHNASAKQKDTRYTGSDSRRMIWYDGDFDRTVPLIKVAEVFKDKKTLKELIPALLRAGASPRTLKGMGTFSSDAFFFAAMNENINFITILRDEIKKQGETPKSEYYKWECNESYLASWQNGKTTYEERIQKIKDERKKELESINNSKEVSLLKKNGIQFELVVNNLSDEEFCGK